MLKKLCVPFYQERSTFYKYNFKNSEYEYAGNTREQPYYFRSYYGYSLEELPTIEYNKIVEAVYDRIVEILDRYRLKPHGRKINLVRHEVCVYIDSDDVDEDYDDLNKEWIEMAFGVLCGYEYYKEDHFIGTFEHVDTYEEVFDDFKDECRPKYEPEYDGKCSGKWVVVSKEVEYKDIEKLFRKLFKIPPEKYNVEEYQGEKRDRIEFKIKTKTEIVIADQYTIRLEKVKKGEVI